MQEQYDLTSANQVSKWSYEDKAYGIPKVRRELC